MKTTRQYYYMDRKGTLRCRVVQESRRRKGPRLKSPAKLGGLLAVLAFSGGMAALLLGNWSTPVSQAARVEVAAVPLSVLAQGDESVSAEDIGRALWADFNESVAEAVQTVEEMPEEEIAPEEPVEEAPVVETVAEAAEEPEEESATAEAPEEPEEEAPAAQTAAETPEEERALEEPEEETPEEPEEEAPADGELTAQAGETPDEAAAEFLEEEVGQAVPALAVAAPAEESAPAADDEAATFLEDEEAPAENAAQPDEAAMFLEDEEPATVTEAAAAPVGAAAMDVPEDEHISVRTIPEAKPPEADAETPEDE